MGSRAHKNALQPSLQPNVYTYRTFQFPTYLVGEPHATNHKFVHLADKPEAHT